MKKNNKLVAQLKVYLCHIKPQIYRRILVPSSIRLPLLHDVIQRAMGWEDYHLHQFIKGETFFIESNPDWPSHMNDEDENLYTLKDLAPHPKDKIQYEYDFGDSWIHTIYREKTLELDEPLKHPICIAGKRACPPEDCGSVPGYYNLVEIFKDPDHEEYEEMLDWVGYQYDPEEFDIEETNKALQFIKL